MADRARRGNDGNRHLRVEPAAATSRDGTSHASYWLIEKNGNGPMEPLIFDLASGAEVLPVFSFREEAELFLGLGSWKDWRIWESGAGEIISLLYGPCAGMGSVALDPLPEMVAEKTVELVCLSREHFVDRITDRERPPHPAWRSGIVRSRSESEERSNQIAVSRQCDALEVG